MAYGVNAPFGLRPLSSITGGSWTEKVNEYYISSTTANGITTGYANSIFTGDPVVFNTANSNANATFINTVGTIALYSPVYADAAPSTFSVCPILGVFVGCEYLSTVTGTNNLIKSAYWPGGAQIVPGSYIKAYVIDDPEVVYDVQMSTHIAANANTFYGLAPTLPVINPAGANNQVTLAGSFGSNFALNVGGGGGFGTITANANAIGYTDNPATGSTLTGQSAYYLDVTTPTGGALTHDYNKTLATLPLKAIGYTRNPNNVARLNPVEFAGTYTLANTPFLNVMVMINNHVYKAGTVGTIFGANQN
jgi:hypothetical protein